MQLPLKIYQQRSSGVHTAQRLLYNWQISKIKGFARCVDNRPNIYLQIFDLFSPKSVYLLSYLESNCAQYRAELAWNKGFKIDPDAAQYLCDAAKNDVRCAKRYLMRTIDYITFKGRVKKNIDLQEVQSTIESIRVKLPSPSHNEMQDALELLHELSDRVKRIDGNVNLLQSNYSMTNGLD